MEEFGEKVVAGARRLSHDFSKDKKKQTSQGRAAVKEALNAIKRTSSNFFAQATGGLPELSEQTHSAIVLKLCDEQQWEERRIILTKEAMYLASAEDDSMKDIVPLFQVEELSCKGMLRQSVMCNTMCGAAAGKTAAQEEALSEEAC
eukprot:2145061-Rhodomonas_salina.2